jgi:acetyl-CoA acyltransferase
VDRQCGSSQQAVHFAAQGVIAGAYDIVVACGVESMSRVPMWSNVPEGKDPFGPGVAERYKEGLVPQGISAELIADKWNLSREQLDEFSARSHHRAAAAATDGRFDAEIAPITVTGTAGTTTVRADEGIRPGTTVEVLATLQPAFRTPEWQQRYPELDWRITAGHASQISDGSAAVLLATSDSARRLGLRPRARVHSVAVVGDDPYLMLTGVIPATERVLSRAGLTLDDIDAIEINEAFASVILAWQAETGADLAKVNVHGGAIALGHPLGCSGARLMTSLLSVLEATDGRYGLQVMCEAGGLANATIIERLR